ncbi:unnamed protein product [Mycena citricolor]|uniref:DNA endonuclease activator Ctp1 C-terminal domain-containing protein n=1 Tax=Mycena citricolor TaxID=2018698 RepID=A0AAD2GWL0_9AGAR|nr:unnamed protein product [Mycena citricolor]
MDSSVASGSDDSRSELSRLRRKLTIAQDAIETSHSKLFEVETQATRLARSFGFDTTYAAQAYIDLADEPTPYRELVSTVDALQTQLGQLRRENEELRSQIRGLSEKEGFGAGMRASADPEGGPSTSSQLRALQTRFSELLAVKLKSEEKYKTDYRKFERLKAFSCSEEIQELEAQLKAQRGDLSDLEIRERRAYIVRLTTQKMKELDTQARAQDKENVAAKASERRSTRRSGTPSSQTNSTKSGNRNVAAAAFALQPIKPNMGKVLIPSSSELEVGILERTDTRMPALQITAKDAVNDSSETEPDTPVGSQQLPVAEINCVDSKIIANPVPASKPKSRTVSAADAPQTHPQRNNAVDDEDPEEAPPRKVRRVSAREAGASPSTALYVESGNTPPRSKPISTPIPDKGKGKGADLPASSSKTATINSKYAIDPAKNDGKDYQYDEVVRGRAERRKLHGGDCECCRDYYEAVGPLPNRLQPPLWRSPPKTPSLPLSRAEAVASHKQSVSRHRQKWTPAKTPPDYWIIGFPDTQEVQQINEKAKEMHAEKLQRIGHEAARGVGRYKKR